MHHRRARPRGGIRAAAPAAFAGLDLPLGLLRLLGLPPRPRGAHFAPRGSRRRLPVLSVVVLTTTLGLSAVGPLVAAPGDEAGITTRVSVASDGSQWPGASFGDAFGNEGPAISADGRHVAFVSSFGNVDASLGDVAGPQQVFVRDRLTGRTTLVSVSPGGTPGDAESGLGQPAISADGRYVAFESEARNLVGPVLEPGVTEAPDLVDASGEEGGSRIVLTFDEPAWSTCPGAGPCTVSMAASRSITAMFGPPTAKLTIDRLGPGAGSVTSSPAGINCGATCQADFSSDSSVTLTATPAAGSTFSGWSGDCRGAGPCRVAMSAARSVVANFSIAPALLTVTRTGSGGGTVTSTPEGIDCGEKCSSIFPGGAGVRLEAVPAAGSAFFGWEGGGCSGTGACTVSMTEARSVGARFDPPVTLSVMVVGATGSGTVTIEPGGIRCDAPSTCSAVVPKHSSVTLTPAAGESWYLAGWSGSCTGTGPCTLTMDAAKETTATFDDEIVLFSAGRSAPESQPPAPAELGRAGPVPTSTLSVDSAGSGEGRVISEPAGIDCGTTCSAEIPTGSALTLTAQPGAGSTFTGWSGYRLVTVDITGRDRADSCSLASGDGTATHVLDCPSLSDPYSSPRWAYAEAATVDDLAGEGGNANPLEAESANPYSALSPWLISAELDLGGADAGGANADVVVYTFSEPVSAVDVAAFAAHLTDASVVVPLEASSESCSCQVRVVFPDGSLVTAVGASVLAGAVQEVVPTGEQAQANLAKEVDLVNYAGGGNAGVDVFVFDRDEDGDGVFDEAEPGATRTTKVSVGIGGKPANDYSFAPSISADGRFVAFDSRAGNLLGEEVEIGVTTATLAFDRTATAVGPAPGPPGEPDTNGLTDVFVHDRDADGDGTFDEGGSAEVTVRVSVADDGSQGVSGPTLPQGDSFEPSISATGRFVAFTSGAVNLVGEANGGPDTNATNDVFVRDRDVDGDGVFDDPDEAATTTVRVSVGAGGAQLPESLHPAISADGRVVAFTNNVAQGKFDVLVHDRDADGDGAFDETAAGARSTSVVSLGPSGAAGNGNSFQPAISGDGRHVSFFSLAGDLIDNSRPSSGRDVFVRDRLRNVTTVVSVASSGARGNVDSDSSSSLSGDGRYLAFASEATNLVAGDTNGVQDVFVRDRIPVARLLPPLADFGTVELGDQAGPRTLELDNVGVGALRVTGVAVVGADADDFTLEAEDCTGATLPSEPGRACTIVVLFAPGAAGSRGAEVVVSHESAPKTRSVASLQGRGVLPPFSLTPSPLDLGPVGVGLSVERTVTITNLAGRPQSLGPLSVAGDDAPDFAVVADDCPASLAGGASCEVRIRFSPGAVGALTAVLGGSIGPQPLTLGLQGAGVPGLLAVGPDPVEFGEVPLATAADRVVTVANDGLGLLRVTGVTVGGDPGAGFSLVADGCLGVLLGPGATCTITLRLTPAQAGPRQGSLTVQAALAGVAAPGASTVALLGAGLPSQATINPNPVDFGPVDVAIPATVTVTVTNEGPGPLTPGPATITGAHSGDFAVAADGCSGQLLAAGASCILELVFVPSAAGDRTGSLAVPGAGVVELHGSGLLFAPVIALSVSLGPSGTVTLVEGVGFRPNAAVRLRWVAADDRPDTPAPLTVTTELTSDGEGRFGPKQVLVLPRDHLGPRTLEARGDRPGTFATASFLVLPGTAQPAGQDVFFIRKTQLVSRG